MEATDISKFVQSPPKFEILIFHYISKFSDNGQLVSSYQRCWFLTTVLQLPIITTTLDPKAMLVSSLRYSKFLNDKKGMY